MSFIEAKAKYAQFGVDVESALERIQNIPVSIHCWQGDDVLGFDGADGLEGGIQTTGNYMGRAKTPLQLWQDFEFACSMIPGKKRINLHACYAVSSQKHDRDELTVEDFEFWIERAVKANVGIDFNPTFFSHPMVKDGLTLSSPDENVRAYWVRHARACRKIAQEFGKRTGTPCLVNIWIPDGFKNDPADRLGPRARLKKSLDEIYQDVYDTKYVIDAVESKVFGIGVESCTVGSSEFYMNYAMQNGKCCLLDNGHFHPTENVADKISSLLLFCPYVALHVTKPVRWDSDHTVMYEDDLKAIANEIVAYGQENRVLIGLDYFDASINRISAWVMGARNMQKALLSALLIPHADLATLQNANDFTHVMQVREELKTLPFSDVWEEYLARQGVAGAMEWIKKSTQYEKEVLANR